MAKVSAKLVKELRDMTNAGMLDCKKALEATDGNIDNAIDFLRKKGLAKAANKSDRLASEGRVNIQIAEDSSKATILEVNSETDFVSKNDGFIELVDKTTKQVFSNLVNSVEDLNKTNIDGSSFEDFLKEKISKIGENIVVRRFQTIQKVDGGFVSGYLHTNARVAVLLSVKGEPTEANLNLAKDVCMHAAAMNPKYFNKSSISPDIIAKEEKLAREQLIKEGKPEAMLEKIIPGKIKKFVDENTLLGQKFVKDDKKSVEQVLKGNSLVAIEFIRYELGEGLEKKGCDFASEVAEQLK